MPSRSAATRGRILIVAAHNLGYNSTRQRVQLYGGFDAAGPNELWEFDGAVWTKVR